MAQPVAIGIDVGGTTTKAAFVTPSGGSDGNTERPTDPSAATKTIISVVDDLLERAGDRDVVAVGVGAAGFIDASSGAVMFSPNLTYDDPHVAAALGARTGLPVAVDNDANAAVWGERTFGVARGADHVAMLTLGTGIGSGFIVGGRLLRGHSGAAAELGHMVVDPAGPECPCGLRGCIEQYASGGAIARMGREAAREHPQTAIVDLAGSVEEIRAEHVAKAAREYDEAARDVMRDAGRWLGLALSNVVNIFDPEMIVLGGGVVRAGEPFLGAARDELVRRTAAQRRRPMRLAVTSLPGVGGILGAAALAFERVT